MIRNNQYAYKTESQVNIYNSKSNIIFIVRHQQLSYYTTILKLNRGNYATNNLSIAANLPDYDNQFPTGARAIVVECIFWMHTRKYHGMIRTQASA